MEDNKKNGIFVGNKKKINTAENDDFLNKVLDKYGQDGKKGIRIITKDKAYLAAQKCIEKFRDLKGEDATNYLKENFKASWDEQDVHGKNKIDITEAYSMLQYI